MFKKNKKTFHEGVQTFTDRRAVLAVKFPNDEVIIVIEGYGVDDQREIFGCMVGLPPELKIRHGRFVTSLDVWDMHDKSGYFRNVNLRQALYVAVSKGEEYTITRKTLEYR